MSKVQHHSTPESKCPVCGTVVDMATGVGGPEAPQPGNISICIKCAGVSKYSEEMTLVPISTEEMAEICDTDPEAWNHITSAVNFIKSITKVNDK